jgi:hypothetical protein|tara:strand:- start:551 stop:1075 length:525 start_codon:yes stop_codon:yes gene_type:complete
MIESYAMFHIPLIRNDVKDWQEKKKKLLNLVNSGKFDMKSNEFVLSDFFGKVDYRAQIQEILQEDIKQSELLIGEGDLKISNAWFEKSRKGMSHQIHNHGALGYSGICYIQYDKKEHTPVQFVAPYNDSKHGQSIHYQPYDVREGTLLIFPSFVHHFTLPNESNKERICLSFNF